MRFTRRHLLAALSGVAVAGGLSAGGLAWRWYDRAPGVGLKALSREEYELAQSVARAWMPRGGEPELSGADADLGAFLDDVVAGMEPATAREFKLLLHVLDDYPILGRFSTFRGLSEDEQQQVLHGWMHSDQVLIRLVIQAVLVLLSVGWTTHPAVVPEVRKYYRCGYGR